MLRALAGLAVLAALTGCALQVAKSAMDHNAVMGQIQLGDTQEKVLALLEPIEHDVPSMYRRAPDEFMVGYDRVLVYYARSAMYQDGRMTDDEFTPYVFRNRILVGKGWAVLGGTKSQASTATTQGSGLLARIGSSGSLDAGASLPLLGPITPNAYGPGVHMDATGRPVHFEGVHSDLSIPPMGPITPNAYGPGIHMDGTGRAMRLVPGW